MHQKRGKKQKKTLECSKVATVKNPNGAMNYNLKLKLDILKLKLG